MLVSTKISLWCLVAWAVLQILAIMIAPAMDVSMDILDEDFQRNFDEDFQRAGTASAVQALGGIFLIASIAAIIVTGFKRIMSKETSSITNIGGHQIVASGFANVATDYAIIDQKKISRDSAIGFLRDKEHIQSLQTVIDYLSGADIPQKQRRYAELLISSIQRKCKT